MKNKLIGFIGAIVLLVLVSYYGAPYIARANPFEFLIENQGTFTITASTSPSYMTPGTGTTTYSYDTYANGGADTYATNQLALMLQFTGSTTPVITNTYATTTYNLAIEYSQDNIDWFSDNYILQATTTFPVNLTSLISRTITLATTTLQGVAIASTTPTRRLINIPSPTRYLRAVITIPIGSTNGAVWGEFVGQKETPR